MPKLILICGKICAGKTAYARRLRRSSPAVLLSSDELMSALFHPNENDHHDSIIGKVHAYLLNKSLEILSSGADVILDWGFWTNEMRLDVNEFCRYNNITAEWHYIDVNEDAHKRNIASRNQAVIAGRTTDYYVDDGLYRKCLKLFEAPSRDEIDVWVAE